MIYAIVGTPGSGKSYETVRYHILESLKAGRQIVTNIPLNLEYFDKKFHDFIIQKIETLEYKPFEKVEDYISDFRDDQNRSAIIFYDECHDTLKKPTKEIQDFFAKSRHYGIDICLITQSLSEVHTSIRARIESTIRLQRMLALGSSKRYKRTEYSEVWKQGSRAVVLSRQVRKLEDKYFPLYSSYTHSSGSVIEASRPDRKIPFALKLFIFMLLFIPFTFFFLLKFASKKPEIIDNNIDQNVQVIPDQKSSKINNKLHAIPIDVTKLFLSVRLDYADKKIHIYEYKGEIIYGNQLHDLGFTIRSVTSCIDKMTYQYETFFVSCKDDDRVRDQGALARSSAASTDQVLSQ